MSYTLEDLETTLKELQVDTKANVAKLDLAIVMMKKGGVGQNILYLYGKILDQAKVIDRAARGAQEGVDVNKPLRDVRAAVPDAGDNSFLIGD